MTRRMCRSSVSRCHSHCTSELDASRKARSGSSCSWRHLVCSISASRVSAEIRDTSTVHSLRTSSTSRSAPSRREWLRTSQGPTRGARITMKAAASISGTRPPRAIGSAGSTSTSEATRCGRREATRMLIRPPMELPTSTTGPAAADVLGHAVHDVVVVRDGGLAPGSRGAAEADQVDRPDVVGARQAAR